MQLNPAQLREVAVKAYADPRTVARYLSGLPVVSTSAMRIEAALVALGYRSETKKQAS
jgi:DNA-binding LacI/PurR family transcriptional regulator